MIDPQAKSKIEKLPKWAQHLITKLENDNQHLRRIVTTLEGEETNVYWDTLLGERGFVPERADVVFDVPDQDRYRVQIEECNGEHYLYINSAQRLLSVQPCSMNAIKVRAVK